MFEGLDRLKLSHSAGISVKFRGLHTRVTIPLGRGGLAVHPGRGTCLRLVVSPRPVRRRHREDAGERLDARRPPRRAGASSPRLSLSTRAAGSAPRHGSRTSGVVTLVCNPPNLRQRATICSIRCGQARKRDRATRAEAAIATTDGVGAEAHADPATKADLASAVDGML